MDNHSYLSSKASVHPHNGYFVHQGLDGRVVKISNEVRDHCKLLCSVKNQLDDCEEMIIT